MQKIKDEELIRDTKSFFNPDSPLKDAVKHGGRPYEYRPQQTEMAVAAAEALTEKHNLCVEAPTGIGKSFAYLVPVILFAKSRKKPVLISTETINLQEQLIEKDIPILKEIMKTEFNAVLAKGRQNYLCMRRLKLAAGDRREEFLPLSAAMPDIEKISRWASATEDGSRSSIDFRYDQFLWTFVCCEVGNCSGPKCTYYRSCFYWRARREWDKADIIVANHALFFTDLKMKQTEDLETTLLPPYSAVVIDEAHTTEDNAAEYMGLHISNSGLFHFLNRLFNPVNGKGLLVKPGESSIELRKLVDKILEQSSSFFNMINQIILEKQDTVYRVRRPGLVPDLLSESLGLLEKKLKEYLKEQEDEDFKVELKSQLQKCEYYALGIYNFLNMKFENHVYWVEGRENSGRGSVNLYAAPLNVDELLRKILFSTDIPAILTSATLTVCRKLDYFKSRTGYTNGKEMILDSPFDYRKQVKIYIPKNMPEPNDEKYTGAAIEEIKRFVSMTHGKAFVLFTNYQTLRTCAEKLETFFSINNLNLLVQGDEMDRSAMLKEFRRDINSVIFGTASFWTGVDVPGEALSNVIITKLPFAVPSHPLIQARSELIERKGLNSFVYYSLPEAILKFRQGIGRLIRSKNDTGIIAILDKRVISKRYGKQFLDSIPPCPSEIC